MAELAQLTVAGESGKGRENAGAVPPASGETVADVPPVAQRRVARPRVVRPPSRVPVSVFGSVPLRCSAWGIGRMNRAGQWEPLSHGDGGVKRHEWPLDELSEESVRDRWGPGTYRVHWYEATAGGGRRHMCVGRTVDFEAPAPVAPPPGVAAPAPVPVGLESLGAALQVIDVLEGRADAKINGMAKLAEMIGGFGGRGGGGVSGDDLVRIMRDERQAAAASTAAIVAAAVDPLRRQIAELSEEEEDGSGLASAAAAAAPLIKGRGAMATALNFAAQNPDLVKTALPIVAGAFSALAALFAQSNAATAEAAAAKREAAVVASRPRAAPPPPPAPPPAPEVTFSSGTGGAEPASAPASAPAS